LAATVESKLARKSTRHHPESFMNYPGYRLQGPMARSRIR
jgi:hypothetical protein